MEKDNISRISVSMLNGENYGSPIIDGDPLELVLMAMCAASSVIKNEPDTRKCFLRLTRRIRKDTAPDWVAYFLDDLPQTLLGAAVLTLAVVGFCWLVHGVLGV